jgi:hypothetical protein
MAKYKIVATPKFPNGGEVELDGYRYKKDSSGKWFYSSGAPVTDPLLIQKLTYEAKPVGTPKPSPYGKPDVRTTDMKISAAKKKGMAYQSTLDELQALEQQKESEKLAEQQRLAQAEAERLAVENARMNAPFNKSETIQGTVAQLAPVTAEQRANVEASKKEYNNKRSFLAQKALDENYDAVAYDLAQDIKRDFPGLTFEEALAKAKEDYDGLKQKALNKYVTQDPEVLSRVADEQGYNTKSRPGNVTMKQQNLGDPNIVSFANPNSVEGYYNRARDITLNPLDAFYYAMSPTESMPYNYKAYEDMKEKTGYTDGADKNLITGAVDFASWFTPVGLYAQGVKMLPETVEAVQKVIDDPSLANAGTAAFDVAMNALTLAAGKSPLKFLAEETQAVRDAQFVSDFMRGRRGPTPSNPGTGYLPIGLPSAEGSPLTNVVRSIDTRVPLYRVEPPNQTFSKNPLAAEYHDYLLGPTSRVAPEELQSPIVKTYLNSGELYNPMYPEGTEMAGVFFPQETAGKWWTTQPFGVEGEVGIVAGRGNNANNLLTTNVPFSKLQGYNVSNNPAALEFAGQPQKEFILPDEYRASATVEPYPSKQPLNIEETLASFSDEEPITRATVKKKSKGAKKQFLEDLQKDPDYIDFRDKATIRNEEGKAVTSYGIPNSVSKDQFRNAGNTYDTVFDVNEDPLKKLFYDLSPEYSAEENETIANLIEDIRKEKIKLWQSPEGERRLQLLIDNTPELTGHTPKSFVQSVQQLENLNSFYENEKQLNAILNDDYDQLEIALNEGRISKRDFQEQADQLDEMLLESDALISNAENLFQRSAGFYSTDANLMGIRPGEFKSGDLPIVIDHEFGHKINSFGKGRTTSPSYLDDELAKLDLVDANPGQLEIPGLVEAAPGMYGMTAPGNNYIDKSINYFLNKSNGTEKVPFLSEIRRDLLQQGIIKSPYDKITPKMLKDRYKDYKKTTGEKFPLRLYDIIKDKPQNFNIMSKVINNLPAILSAVGVADAFLGEEDPNVNEAGLSLLIGAIGKGRRGVKNFSKKTAEAFTFRDKALRKLADQANKTAIDAYKEYQIASNKNISISNKFLDEVTKVKDILPNALERTQIGTRELLDSFGKQAEIARLERNLPNIEVTDKGLKIEKGSPLSNVITKGEGQITSFKTGKPVQAIVELPSKSMVITPKDKKLEYIHEGNSNPVVSQEYLTTLHDNINHVEQLTGGKVYGSAIGVTKGGLPHITGDVDVLILDTDYGKNVENSLQYLGDKGGAKIHNIGVSGEEGNIDFNIIHTNSNGNIKVNWTINPMTGEKRSLELELFRQFFPDEYYAEQKKAIQRLGDKLKEKDRPPGAFISLSKGNDLVDPELLGLEINIPAKEFMDKIDPATKTIVDAYESSKDKHINRIDTYINYGNPSAVKKGQETYVKSLVGSKGSIGPQLSTEALSDVNANIEALREMSFLGDIESVAQDPERMQLALNDFYINNSIHNRQVSHRGSMQDLENAFKKWDITQGGGNLRGFGLNTVKLGNPQHTGNILGQMQYELDVNTTNPLEYVNSIKFATSGGGVFTPEQKEIVTDIIKYHSGVLYDEQSMSEINKTGDLLSNSILQHMSMSDASKKNIQKIYNDITKRLGIRSAAMSEGDTYGTSYYASILGDFDEAKDLLQYSIINIALKPKSLFTRRNNFANISNNTPSGQIDPDLIKSFQDYKKIENMINGGLQKLKERSERLQELMRNLDNIVDEKARRYAAKKNPELKKELDDIRAQVQKYSDEVNENTKLEREYLKQANQIKSFRQTIIPLILSAGVVGTLGTVVYSAMTNPSASERHGRVKKIDTVFQTDELSKKEKAYVNRYLQSKGSLKGFTWPDGTGIQSHHTVGEGMLLKNPHLKPPPKRFKEGGVIELELTPKQIQEYVAKGYIVEEQ